MNGKKEFGDYQTPVFFAEEICKLLCDKYSISPQFIVEPTCGLGNFIKTSQIFKASYYYGIEINKEYCSFCESYFAAYPNVNILNKNIFDLNLEDLLPSNKEILIVGNPPWVTNSELSKHESSNVPQKTNFKFYNGFNAITGASNFDICEYIILKCIECIRSKNAVLAMLCKNSVARNVFCELNRRHVAYSSFSIYNFDAKRVFGIAASACLLVIDFRNSPIGQLPCSVFSFKNPYDCCQTLIYSNNEINANDVDKSFFGKCCFEWRQGIKHDCSKVMELHKVGDNYFNGLEELVDIEDDYVFPLVKSGMFKTPIINSFTKYVIVTQTKIKDDTEKIKIKAPKTWEYLLAHSSQLCNRKSSIYKNAPPFSMFGVGDYSFAKYKVGISGFYKTPLFSLIYDEDSTVMCDDTCYFIAFSNFDEAYVMMLVLNSNIVIQFIKSSSFSDAKRPFTKQLLKRLNMKSIMERLTFDDLIETEKALKIPPHITKESYLKFNDTIFLMGGFI